MLLFLQIIEFLHNHGVYYPLHIIITQCMMHGQTNNTVRHLVRLGQVLRCRTRQATVCGERADKGIEISAAENVTFLHLEIKLIARHAVFLCIHENGEI